jgi:hypothetical protein
MKAAWIMLGGLLAALGAPCWGDSPFPPGSVKTFAALAATQSLALEPIEVMLTVENTTSNQTVSVTGSWDLFVEYRMEASVDRRWRLYQPDNTPLRPPSAPSVMKLAPNAKRRVFVTLAYGGDGKAVSEQAGWYEIKLTYGPLAAEVVRVEVREPHSAEEYAFLRERQLPRFFSLEASRVAGTNGVGNSIRAFLARYPSSEYVPLIRTAESLLSMRGDRSEAIRVSIPTLTSFGQGHDARSARVKWYLAECLERLGDLVAREATLRELAGQQANPVAKARAESALLEAPR